MPMLAAVIENNSLQEFFVHLKNPVSRKILLLLALLSCLPVFNQNNPWVQTD